MKYLVANLNGDTSFLLAPPLTSSENLHSSQPPSKELERSYRQSPRSMVRLSSSSKSGDPLCLSSSSNSGAPKSSPALSQTAGLPPARPPPSAPLSEATFTVELLDGTLQDFPDSEVQVVVLGEEEVGEQGKVEQAGQERHEEQRMVIDIRYDGCIKYLVVNRRWMISQKK